MKRLLRILVPFFVATSLWAQQSTTQPSGQPTGQKTLAATLNVYAFPTKGQTPERQSQDEAACYQYAVTSTGTDPFA